MNVLETKRLILRPWQDSDAASLFKYASNPNVGPIAGWPVHTSEENSLDIIRGVLSAPETYAVVLKESGEAIWCGYYDGNEKSKRGQEKCGFRYHHTEQDKSCQLMGDIRTEHFTRLCREEWREFALLLY